MSVYTLAISPDERISGVVKKLKKRLEKHLGRSYSGVDSAGHITLILFMAYEEDYPSILAEFKRVLAGLAPLDIDFSGFGDFSDRPECTFYIQPDEFSVELIIEYCKQIGANFNKFVKRKYTEKFDIVGRRKPHMSIGRELTGEEIQQCYALFSEGFSGHFQSNYFVLRKLNEENWQYEIVDAIPLLGHEYMAGQQMRLF